MTSPGFTSNPHLILGLATVSLPLFGIAKSTIPKPSNHLYQPLAGIICKHPKVMVALLRLLGKVVP